MKCACGFQPERNKKNTSGRQALNQHRKKCPVFWESVYAEISRIATMLYSKPMAISMSEWNRYRCEIFPSWEGMRDWGKQWSDIQQESGFGQSRRGRGALVAKGKIADDTVLWQHLDAIAATERAAIMDDEKYTALCSDSLSVCEETYRRTGRMILR